MSHWDKHVEALERDIKSLKKFLEDLSPRLQNGKTAEEVRAIIASAERKIEIIKKD